MFPVKKWLKNRLNYKSSALIPAVLLFLVLMPVLQAHASDPVTDWVERKMLGTILLFVLNIIIRFVSSLQQMLDLSLKMSMLDASGQPFTVVTKSWETMRSFANMFF